MRNFLLVIGCWMLALSGHGQDFVAHMLAAKVPPHQQQVLSKWMQEGLITQYQSAFSLNHPYLNDWFLLDVPTDQLSAQIAQLEAVSGGGVYLEPIPVVHGHYVPNDFDSAALYHLPLIRAPEAWDIERGNPDITIAIIDNSLMTAHDDLAPNLWQNQWEVPGDNIDNDRNGFIDDTLGWDFSDNDPDIGPATRSFDHGTHVAGCAGAATDNGVGIASIGFRCRLMGLKVASDGGSSNSYSFIDVIRAMEYAIENGADVVNMSFGAPAPFAMAQDLIDVGHDRGIVFVGSAGNSPIDTNPITNDTTWHYPASFRHVISVAATDRQDKLAGFSTRNHRVDLCAPGEQIRSTVPSITLRSSYRNMRGTSQSAPMVAGLIGLMKSHNPCLSPDEVLSILQETAVGLDSLNPSTTGMMGAGRIDAAAALERLRISSSPRASFSLADSTSCTGIVQPRFLADSIANCPQQFSWICSNGQISLDPFPRFQLSTSGSYTFTLVVENAFGKDSLRLTKFIQVSDLKNLEAGTDSAICFGETLQLSPSVNTTIAKAVWQPSAGLSSDTLLTPEWTASANQQYTLTVFDSLGCSLSDRISLSVNPRPTVFAGLDQKILRGDTVQFEALGNASRYKWTPNQFLLPSDTARTILVFPTTTTLYSLRGWSVNDCQALDSVQVEVDSVLSSTNFPKAQPSFQLIPPVAAGTRQLLLRAHTPSNSLISISLWDIQGRKVAAWPDERPNSLYFEQLVTLPAHITAGIYWLKWRQDWAVKWQKLWIRPE